MKTKKVINVPSICLFMVRSINVFKIYFGSSLTYVTLFLSETSVGFEQRPAFFNTSSVPPRSLFQSHLDMQQDHNSASPFYTRPPCCLDLNECECQESCKLIPQNSIYRPVLPAAFPRMFTPRCVSTNMAYDPARSGLESFAFQPLQATQSTELPLVKSETD